VQEVVVFVEEEDETAVFVLVQEDEEVLPSYTPTVAFA
jgi:hypothetical protein